jgi:uncharacterized membrane protein YbhN (UPF0104 family)
VLQHLGRPISRGLALSTSLLGYVAGGLTPGGSGEVLRARALASHAGVPTSDGVTLVVYERLLSAYLLVVTTSLFVMVRSLHGAWWALPLLFGATAIGLPWLLALHVLPRLPSDASVAGNRLLQRALRCLLWLASRLRLMFADLRLMLLWSACTLSIFALISAQFLLLVSSVGAVVGLDETWITFGTSQIAGIVSLLPLGLGVTDASLATVLHTQSLTLAQASLVALLVRATITLPLLAATMVAYAGMELSGRPRASTMLEPQGEAERAISS